MHRDTIFTKGIRYVEPCWLRTDVKIGKKLISRAGKHIVQDKHHVKLDMVIHAFNISTWDVDKKSGSQGLLCVRWSDQPNLQKKLFSKNQKETKFITDNAATLIFLIRYSNS